MDTFQGFLLILLRDISISHLPRKYGDAALKKGDSYLIMDVSVIPMEPGYSASSLSCADRTGKESQISSQITAIDTSSNPLLINGKGKFLIPGLNDMHIHLNDENNLLLFIANGVTTVSMLESRFIGAQGKTRRQEILGPSVYTAGAIWKAPLEYGILPLQ